MVAIGVAALTFQSAVLRPACGGVLVDGFDPSPNNAVNTIVVQPDGKIIIGGSFTSVGGLVRNRIARLNGDGNVDTTFDSGGEGAGGIDPIFVSSIALQSDGKVIVGGSFTMLGGQSCTNIGRLNADGSLDMSFNPGADNWVFALAIQGDGKILAGGLFNTLGGQPRSRIGRLKPNGSLDTEFNPGSDGSPFAFALQPDAKIIIGGAFSTLAGQPRANFGLLNQDGSLDQSFNVSADCSVRSLTIQGDGGVAVGGCFNTLDGQPHRSLGRLAPGGSLDTNFNAAAYGSGSTYMYALLVETSGKILAGGYFTNLDGKSRSYVGRLNADGSLDETFDPGASGIVSALAVQADGKILVGGVFDTLGGLPRRAIGRLVEAGGLAVSVSELGINRATNHFQIIAPTNTINLQAIVAGNAATPSFQWCRESADQSGKVVYDDVIFTDPNSSNTTVIFDYAGSYTLSVTASDGIVSHPATVTVSVGLNPNGSFQNISNFLNASAPDRIVNTNRFLTKVLSTSADATNYYAAIDPKSNKMTFSAWKSANAFPPDPIPPATNGALVSATYFNALDLGFGRRMIMRKNGTEWAFAVSNFTNVNDAAAGKGLIATVAMDYSPANDGGPNFTKFYVFSNDLNETRVASADLDFGGQKFVPGLCVVCHGGTTGTVHPGDSGNVHAHFLPFDLQAFDYSRSNGLSRTAQEGAFKSLNLAVLEIEQRIPTDDGPAFGRPAITNLVSGWYGPGLTQAIQNSEFVPAEWQDASLSGILSTQAQAYLYHNLIASACRSCHSTRDPATSSFSPGLSDDFRAFGSFNLWRSNSFTLFDAFATIIISTPQVVMSTNSSPAMPAARRTFERFWNSIAPRPQPEILRDYLLDRLNSYSNAPSSIVVQNIGTDVQIRFSTETNGSYRLEYTDHLFPPLSSTPLDGNISGTGGTNLIIQPIDRSQPARFFRVRSLP